MWQKLVDSSRLTDVHALMIYMHVLKTIMASLRSAAAALMVLSISITRYDTTSRKTLIQYRLDRLETGINPGNIETK
jgi:hypothetical protein